METMTAPRTERFKMLLHVTRAVEENGKTYVEGIATGSQEDWYGDVMAPECVASMVRQFNAGTLPLRSSHQADWEGDLGVIESGAVQYGGDASIRALLDMEDARAQKLVRSLTRERPAKLGLSIGGMADYDSITWDTRDDKVVRVIHDITLDHVAVTSQPAYPNAWMSGVAQKSAPASPHAFPWYASGNNIRGAQLMTEQERHDYVAHLQSVKTLPECQAYWTGHNKEIDARAAQQHVALPPIQGNPCEVMVRMGRIH